MKGEWWNGEAGREPAALSGWCPTLNHRPNKPIVVHLACERMLANPKEGLHFGAAKKGPPTIAARRVDVRII